MADDVLGIGLNSRIVGGSGGGKSACWNSVDKDRLEKQRAISVVRVSKARPGSST